MILIYTAIFARGPTAVSLIILAVLIYTFLFVFLCLFHLLLFLEGVASQILREDNEPSSGVEFPLQLRASATPGTFPC